VGAIVRDGDGRLLVVRRANPPAAGSWSLPGGRVEDGETDRAAAAREIREETGLDVAVGELVGSVERDGGDGVVYVIRDYACTVRGGRLVAGDDAADARWVTPSELAALDCSPGLVGTLTAWGVLE
jgi:ADP-ribose pyrophosphatase YjhB (NUDIX family)